MKANNFAFLAFAATVLTAAGAYWLNYEQWVKIPAAEKIMADQLRDPASTQFRNSRLRKSGWLCGELNSKNGNGGYVGFKKFISGGADSTYYVEGHGVIGEKTHEQLMAFMDEKIKLLQGFNELRARNLEIRAPSESQQEEIANAAVFNVKWSEICE